MSHSVPCTQPSRCFRLRLPEYRSGSCQESPMIKLSKGILKISAVLLASVATIPASGWTQPIANNSAGTSATTESATELPDNYQWLEDVHGERSMAWVKAENERTAKVLEADPRFDQFKAEALKVLESPDRLAIPDFRNGTVYNTWQDADHVRGIVRRTT